MESYEDSPPTNKTQKRTLEVESDDNSRTTKRKQKRTLEVESDDNSRTTNKQQKMMLEMKSDELDDIVIHSPKKTHKKPQDVKVNAIFRKSWFKYEHAFLIKDNIAGYMRKLIFFVVDD